MLLRGKQASGLLTQQKMLRAAVKLFLKRDMRARRPRRSPAPRACRQARFSGPFPVRRRCCLSLTSGCSAGSSRWPSSTARHVLYEVGGGYPAPHRRADRATAQAVRDGLHAVTNLGIPVSQHGEAAGGHLRGRSSGRGGQGLLRDGDRLDGHDAFVRGRTVRHVLYRGAQDRALFGVRA